ncbi:MAG: hypothetical protein GXO86_00025 [Chlorobi bacterium]|nr:hypothetical protein [Chlorobiota bacterium]
MLADKQEVQNMIPQAPPMVMVDGLLSSDEQSTTSRLVTDKNNIFCQNGYFHEPGLIENMAQTVALRGGYEAWKNGTEVKKGFIGSVKNFTVFQLPAENTTLHTTITVTSRLMNATMIRGQIFANDTLIAEGEMSIFEQ